MKNVLFKNSIKQIKNTKKRFISILVMALLGVGFFAGLYATGPDMRESLDKYLDDTNTYDISIVSTLGLSNDDITELQKIKDLKAVYGIKEKNAEITINEKEYVVNFIDYNENINLPVVVDGRLPQKSNECVIDQRFHNEYKYNIEDKIIIDDADNEFKNDELTIVGIIESPLYISSDKGITKLGSGSIDCIAYSLNNIDVDYYSSIGIKVNGAMELQTDTKKYDEIIANAKNEIEKIKEERQTARYNQLIDEANEKLNKAQKEFDDEKKKGEEKLADAEKQINDGKEEIKAAKTKLASSKKELSDGKNKANKEFKAAENEISSAKKQIENSKKELDAAKEKFNYSKNQAEYSINEINTNISELEKQKEYLESISADTTQIVATINSLKEQVDNIKNELQAGQKEISSTETKIKNAETEVEKNAQKLKEEKSNANKKFAQAQVKIENAEKEISKNENKINKAEKELENSKKEFTEKINDAEKKLNDSKKEIDKIEVAKWYIQDRKDNTGYNNVTQAVTSIVNLSKVFPILFYVIAILISLTSMTRMVEEERVEIGTLKALGYNNIQIIFKYILYAMLASVIGGVIGMFVGLKLIPNIIWIMYSIIYYLPSFTAKLKIEYGILGIAIAFVCIGGATFFVSYKELKNMPAVLMRPKAPKNGKRVILEKITFLWKRLTFSQKVTIRNLFRYKKRVLMTIIGIAGCTALILAGFGIRDSISSIIYNQFEKVNNYDISVMVSSDEDTSDLLNYLDNEENIKEKIEVNMQTGKLSANGERKDVKINVPKENEELYKVINLIDRKTKQKVELSNDGIIITDKIADLLNVNEGDTVTLADNNDVEYEFKVNAIVENYVEHYVYISKEVYENKMKEKYQTNMFLINTNDISDEELENLSKEIVSYNEVSGINLVNNLVAMVENILSLLNYIVVILIVSAALLAFVVLYNLANVNISERKREIATLKVLGFYDKEVDDYINKESIILTIIGIVIGLGLGYLLTRFLMTTCETETLRFGREISGLSYMYAIVMTSIFTFLVNKIIHFSLKKIDMIESLKSIE